MNAEPAGPEQAAQALLLLGSLGWRTLADATAQALCGGKREALLGARLIQVLRTRRFDYKGERHRLSPGGIEQILRQLRAPGLADGLLAANERFYRMLTLGVTVTEFMPDGKRHQATIALIDWEHPEANHWDACCSPAFVSVHGAHQRSPALVGYVNGLPLVVIETGPAPQAIARQLRHQRADEIPQLFAHAQLLLAGGAAEARYGTTGTPRRFWARWCEEEPGRPPAPGSRSASELERLMAALLRPARLLDLLRHYVLFDRKAGKVVARHQQYFGVRALMQRVQQRRTDGARQGGVLWHTAGSGKSYTMVFFAKALLSSAATRACRLLVVTDRIELENQLARNFHDCGAFGPATGQRRDSERARVGSGRELALRIGRGRERIVFTLIHKFATAARLSECYNPSADVVVLADEGHRSHGGTLHARLRKALPRAACLAFTGTPLLREEKAANPFGPVVHAYTMARAIGDEAVLPLLYEERMPAPVVDATAVNLGFEAIAAHLPAHERAALQRRVARRRAVQGADGRIALIAWDIAQHFTRRFRQTDKVLKGQVATASKSDAIRYRQHLNATGLLRCEIVMSAPDAPEGSDAHDEGQRREVRAWWDAHVGRHPRAYEERVLREFGGDGGIDLIIVVDRLLTGFDEPRNAVLYIDKPLKSHNLIQAVSRVNRLHEAKRHGLLVDYRGILRELDTAMRDYQDLEARAQGGYDLADIAALYRPLPPGPGQAPRPRTASASTDPLEQRLRTLLDEHVRPGTVRQPAGLYRIHSLSRAGAAERAGTAPAAAGSSNLDASKRETLAVPAPGNAGNRALFSDLLRQAMADAQAPFDAPLPQATLLRALHAPEGNADTPGPQAWLQASRLVLGAGLQRSLGDAALMQLARDIDAVVQQAHGEHSLDPLAIEASIRQVLLPRLYPHMPLETARELLAQVVQVARPSWPDVAG